VLLGGKGRPIACVGASQWSRGGVL
jgi:hypothetical protein